MKFLRTLCGLTIIGCTIPGIAHAQMTSVEEGSIENPEGETMGVLDTRFDRLTRGINLSHWFAQSYTYHPTHLQSFITDTDFKNISNLGFEHVRLSVDPMLLYDQSNPEVMNTEYLGYLDSALDSILQHNLAVIVDVHPEDTVKQTLATDDAFVDTFAQFSGTLAKHLSTRDANSLFLEVLNEPSFGVFVEEGVNAIERWDVVQNRLLSAMREGAPEHTLIATGHAWSGVDDLVTLTPVEDENVVYNFHFYESMPFTHQGADWIDEEFTLLSNLPYPYNEMECNAALSTITDPATLQMAQSYCDQKWDADRIKNRIAKAANWASKNNVRLTANEFGVYKPVADPEDRAAWIHDVRVALEEYDIGWTMWDYTGGFGVVDKVDGERVVNQAIVEALGLPGFAAEEPVEEQPVPETPPTDSEEPVEEQPAPNPVVIPPIVIEGPIAAEPPNSEQPPMDSEEPVEQGPVLNPVVVPPGSPNETPTTPRKIPEPSAIAGLGLLGVGGLGLKRRRSMGKKVGDRTVIATL